MFINVQEVTITKVNPAKGGSQIRWNVELDGKPFGQIWTFKKKAGFKFMFHAKSLAGEYGEFETYAEAERFIRGLM